MEEDVIMMEERDGGYEKMTKGRGDTGRGYNNGVARKKVIKERSVNRKGNCDKAGMERLINVKGERGKASSDNG